MNSKVGMIIMFAVGAAAGSAVTYKLVSTKYERILKEEIDSVKEVFSNVGKNEAKDISDPNITLMEKCDEIINDNEYIPLNDDMPNIKEGETVTDEPYVISPEEFGDFDDYDLVSLTYYSDGVLTDSADEPILEDDLDDFVGRDFANHFGEYEDDSVFIRNDRIKIDYEILRDLRTYSEVVGDPSSK